jgi:chemotaxis protein methyltransferase CheR
LPEEQGWETFVKKIKQKSGVDLTSYKRPQMERRINSFMRSTGVTDYEPFFKMLNENSDLYRRFVEHLTINVSEFFRNFNHWEILRQQILPELIRGRSSLKIWSAGCSTGEEPYSLAIMMREHFSGKFDRIWATDLDQEVLTRAQAGRYHVKALQSMSNDLVKKYFMADQDTYTIKDEIKSLVKFQKQDLLTDNFPPDFDLILCRNVVIYFTEETKERLYRKFARALRTGGILFIGSTEQIFRAREIGLTPVSTFFYQKV